MIISFTSGEATLLTAGGKGANLARLTRAGFPVPPGFIITTDAYRAFVEANRLSETIAASIRGLAADDADQLETASTRIRAAFTKGRMPDNIDAAIRVAQAELGDGAVAVRSSATAEDLPDLSFAGQQDTFLNIIGPDNLLKAVIDCWSSLWTARAIGYRVRNGISHDDTALAVVTQAMANSDVSGVMFTANPLTGLLTESVIEATFGLGEALVSGQVEPDRFVVDARSGAILETQLGAKKVATRGKAGGGVETIMEEGDGRRTLTDAQIRQLAALGQRVEQEYGTPQDIEWAFAGEDVFLLQARAITSLFPVPEVSIDPLKVWFSFGAVQGLMEPMTPLGRDVIFRLIAGGGALLGLRLDPEKTTVFAAAGERIWVRMSDVMRNPLGSRVIYRLLSMMEPSARQILLSLADDPRLGAGKGRVKLSTLWRLAGLFLPMLWRAARNMAKPEEARARFEVMVDEAIHAARVAPANDRAGRLEAIIAFINDPMGKAFTFVMPTFVPLFGPAMAGLNALMEIAGENRGLGLEVTRGLPNNVTTEMDMALWQTAAAVRADAKAASAFQAADPRKLADDFLNKSLPATAQTAIGRFMDRYGMRGVAEFDFGQPRWREDPTPVMNTLQSYLAIDPQSAPDAVFARGEQAAMAAIEKLATEARRQPGGRIKEKLARGAARRVRAMMGARESPKFYMIRLMGIARAALLEVGKELVPAGVIDRPDDLVFLTASELKTLARDEKRDWKELIAERRAAYERERRRRQVPRALASDGRAFYEGLGAETDTEGMISGSPVSPGTAEGIVHVVHDPRGTQLAPGEILVCPGTDPAWTPLFMAAGGLITEVGGMMTHGSVVAREYGIPAVVGVHKATERLKTGQRVRVDGTTGKIAILS